jgi:thymidylate synthase ThyX
MELTEGRATVITDQPIVEVIAEMKLDQTGVMNMAKWVQRYRPDCVPKDGFREVIDLLPHDGRELWGDHRDAQVDTFGTKVFPRRRVTDNELLCELAGRKCYDSFAEKGAKRTNSEYLASMWTGRGVPHRSTGYHAKMSFFFAHVSRRVSHELIRNYVGADRDEEGSPSQESTRFTEHPGVYICHPRDCSDVHAVRYFTDLADQNYDDYLEYIETEADVWKSKHGGQEPKGMDRKRIYEAASGRLLQSCATSFIWTTNPMAMAKFFAERCDEASDLEMQRFANTWKQVALARWPNLFPGVK